MPSITVKARAAQHLGVRLGGASGTDPATRPDILAQKITHAAGMSAALDYLFKKPWTGTVADPTSPESWKQANLNAVELVNQKLVTEGVPLALGTNAIVYTPITNSNGEIIGHMAVIIINSTITGLPSETNTAFYGVLHGYAAIAIG